MTKTLITVLLLAFGLTACSIDVEANPDGTLTVESVLLEADMQQSLEYVIDDPNVENLDIEFHDGYASIDATGTDEHTGDVNNVTFDVRLSVVDGHLGAEVYNGMWNGHEIPEWIVEAWNEAIARQLEAEGRKDPNSDLVAVSLTDDSLTMEWLVSDTR
ncbi:MAG: hypothetical protein DWQ40_11440 [Actinobacteria bacterium]|nr:MAG: hypothetical protein DWQ40_11440 [Actinomycetota bacterium]